MAADVLNGTLRGPVVIAVEGRDYWYSIKSHYKDKFPDDVQLWDYKDGGNTFGSMLQILVGLSAWKRKQIKAFGVIMDAEEGRDSAEKSIKTALQNRKLPAPAKSLEIAKSDGKPATAFLVMPHDKNSGCLDTALLAACTAPDNYRGIAEKFVQEISAIQKTPNGNLLDKRRVRSLIARSPTPYRTVSHCVGSLWDFDQPSLKIMLDFIELVRNASH